MKSSWKCSPRIKMWKHLVMTTHKVINLSKLVCENVGIRWLISPFQPRLMTRNILSWKLPTQLAAPLTSRLTTSQIVRAAFPHIHTVKTTIEHNFSPKHNKNKNLLISTQGPTHKWCIPKKETLLKLNCSEYCFFLQFFRSLHLNVNC